MTPLDEAGEWAPWPFEARSGLARYVSDEAEDFFPVAGWVSWNLASPLERQEAIQKIYEMLAGLPEGQRISYALEEYHPDAQKQQVRSPRKIWESRRGTCLDLTLLFCGLCLSLRLCPVVVIARDHAYALLALKRTVGGLLPLDEEPLRDGPVTDLDQLRRWVDEGRYVALECTGFAAVEGAASRPPMSFAQAVEAGRKNLEDRGLRFALDVASARYLRGEPAFPERSGEPPWPLLRRRWVRWEEARKDGVRESEQLNSNAVDSRALTYFERFLLDAAWHQRIGDLIDGISRPSISDARVQKLQETVQSVDLTASYPTLHRSLETALKPPGIQVVHDSIGRLERSTGLSHRAIPANRADDPEVQELERLRTVRKLLFDLQEEVREPRYRRCLCLLGETGSGKTHLSVTFQPDVAAAVLPEGQDWIPSSDEEWRSLLLWLRPDDSGDTLRGRIEQLLRQITGYEWKSLEDFQDYLRRTETWLATKDSRTSYGLPRLVVIVDDLDRWLRSTRVTLKEIENLIRETSQLHSLYWVLTLQHTAFPEVTGLRDFWSAYAWLDDSGSDVNVARQQIGSWIDLDRLNQLDLLGVHLVENESGTGEQKSIRLKIESGTPMERDLSNPQNAWTLLHSRGDVDLHYLVNLNFTWFAERFWKLRQDRIDSEPLGKAMLDRLVGAAAKVMMEELGFQPRRTALVSAVVRSEKGNSDLEDPGKVETGIRIMENAGLWQEREMQDEVGALVHLELRNQFYWSYRLARYLAVRLKSQGTWNLATLLPEGTDPYLREGVIEFLLLEMSESGGSVEEPSAGSLAGRLWQQALELPGATRASAWIGAAKARPGVQRLVAEASRGIRPEGDREIFAFLYFLGEAAPEVLSPAERMKRLQPLFRSIAAAGQVDYFLHVLLKALERVESRDELLDVLANLVGVEVLQETRWVATFVADAALRVCGNVFERVLDLLIEYARRESVRIRKAPEPGLPPDARLEEGKYRLREWVFFATLAAAADVRSPNGPADLFPILWQANWYNAQRLNVILRPVGFEMEAQANTVLGYQYRQSFGDERKDYETLIARLAHSGSWFERKLAFYLIRHSVATGGRRGVRVHGEFHSVLADLFLDPDPQVQKHVQRFYEDFRVNLLQSHYDFSGLDQERNSLLKRIHFVVPKPRDRQDGASGNRRHG